MAGKNTMGEYWEIEAAPAKSEGGGDDEIEAAAGGGDEESIASLAKATGAKDPVALVKLIKRMIEVC